MNAGSVGVFRLLFFCTLLVMSFWTTVSVAQELAPRAYWPAPTGTKVLGFGYQFSSGDVLSDPTLPVTGVESKINLAQVSYLHTSKLFGRTVNALRSETGLLPGVRRLELFMLTTKGWRSWKNSGLNLNQRLR